MEETLASLLSLNGGRLVATPPPICHCLLVVFGGVLVSLSSCQPTLVDTAIKTVPAVHESEKLLSPIDSMNQRNNPVFCGNEMNRLLFEISEPGGELFGGVNGCRKENQVYLRRKEDHGFLPYGSPISVIDVVALIEDYGIQAIQREAGCDAEVLGGSPLLE
jgi:hypothetical protein